MSPLAEWLIVCQYPELTPVGPTHPESCARGGLSAKAVPERVANLEQVNELVAWIVHRGRVASEDRIEDRIANMMRCPRTEQNPALDPVSPIVVGDLTADRYRGIQPAHAHVQPASLERKENVSSTVGPYTSIAWSRQLDPLMPEDLRRKEVCVKALMDLVRHRFPNGLAAPDLSTHTSLATINGDSVSAAQKLAALLEKLWRCEIPLELDQLRFTHAGPGVRVVQPCSCC